MPTWLFRFLLGLRCRIQDRVAAEADLSELFDDSFELPTDIYLPLSPWWEIPPDRLSVAKLRRWLRTGENAVEGPPLRRQAALPCPLDDCPLRRTIAKTATSQDSDPRLRTAFNAFLRIAGGPGRDTSVGAFLDLVRKTKAEWCKGKVDSVYITDRFIFADTGERHDAGGYNTLVSYLRALGLEQKSEFALYLPSSPSISNRQRKRGNPIAQAQKILHRLIVKEYPLVQIKPLPQRNRFHDRLYLVRDEHGALSGVFGPSMNGLRSTDIALMGPIDDQQALRQLDYLLAS